MLRKLVVLLSLTAVQTVYASVVNCDPTANTLAGCISSATSSGTKPGTVVLIPNSTTSTFSVTSTVNIPSNLTIRCEPNATVQENGAGTYVLEANGVQNIVLDGCIIDGHSGTAVGIFLDNVSTVRLSHNTFQNFQAEGIRGQGWQDIEIDDNVFSSVGPIAANDSALYLFAQNGPPSSTRIKIHHNTCNNSNQQSGCMKFAASNTYTLTQIAVTDNILNVGTGSSSANNLGIEFYATDSNDTDIQNFSVSGNIVSSNAGATYTSCLSIGGRHGVISHNTLSNCQLFGIEVIASYTDVVGNALTSTGPISWDGNSATHADVLITNNTTIGATGAAAIHLVAGNNGTFSLFTGVVGHNVIEQPAGSTTGVLVQTLSNGGVDDIHIDDNMFDAFQTSQRAVDVEGSPAQVQVENNRFINDTGTGVFLNKGANLTIRMNYFNGTTWLTNNGASGLFSSNNIVNGVCCQ